MPARVSLAALSLLLIVLLAAIVAQVVCNMLDINPIWTFAERHFLLGKGVTLNSLLDLQWHLLVIVGLLPAGLVWLSDAHVRVDFLYAARSDRWKARVNLLGNVVFALPFFVLMLPAAWDFTRRAWRSDEASRNGGLDDLWLIKAVLPLGLALLGLAVLVETVRLIRRAR